MSRNGFWWEKSQKSFSGSREGWDEREKDSKCLTQIKQPKKNIERKKRKAMTSIFFLVNFFHFLSIWESKNGSFWQGVTVGREISVPLLCVPAPCDHAWGRALLPASAGGCLSLLPVGQCQGMCDTEGDRGVRGCGLSGGGDKHQSPPFPVLPQPPGTASSMVWPLSPCHQDKAGSHRGVCV